MVLFRFVFIFLCLTVWADESQKKQVRFIVNPISVKDQKESIEKLIPKILDLSRFEYEIVYTRYRGHAEKLSREAADRHCDIVAIVGGDGSVNEAGKGLIDTQTTLAIIPTGSGNGLARHLKIPLDIEEAIGLINDAEVKLIDTVRVNDESCFNVAGVGFDGHIGLQFADQKNRGFLSYIRLVLKELPKYKATQYEMTVDGKSLSREAFLISFANSSQWGNNAMIAPKAKIDDGLMDVVILRKFPIYATFSLAYRLFHRSFHHSDYQETLRAKEIVLKSPNMEAHVDGEPRQFKDEMRISVKPASLRVLIHNREL